MATVVGGTPGSPGGSDERPPVPSPTRGAVPVRSPRPRGTGPELAATPLVVRRREDEETVVTFPALVWKEFLAGLVVIGGAGCEGPADASFIGPALTWTVRTLTGFIGSAEPGIDEIAWVWMTPLVSGAGSDLAEAVAAAKIERETAERGGAAGSVDAT